MRLYLEVAWRSLRRATTYRSSYVAGILTNAFFAALLCFVYQAVYAEGQTVAGLSLHDALSYTWATQALISIGGGWIISNEVALSIRTGDIATDLSRPWNFYGYWLSRSLGERLFNLLFRGSLTYFIGIAYFGAKIPSLLELALFVPAAIFSLLISFAYAHTINLTAFWLLDNSGVTLVANVILQFFSGFLLPIAFLPPLMIAIANVLPFQAITGLPVQLILGQIDAAQALPVFALQALWTLVMTGLALLIQRMAMRKLIVQGG